MKNKQNKKKTKKIPPKNNPEAPPSELRQDLVTDEWVVIATGRAKRPDAYIKKDKPELKQSKKDCPFEDPQASGNAEPLLIYKDKEDWSLQVIPNKYPALSHLEGCGGISQKGEYLVHEGNGYHEVIITRDHSRHIALMENEEVSGVVRAYQQRYKKLKKDKCIKYISIFHNHGPDAGASLPHPHSQLIATPVLPVSIQRSLRGSGLYWRRNMKCVHCVMIAYELIDKERVIFENDDFVAFCPFVSRAAFEIRIFPKKHNPYFERMPQRSISKFAEALHASLKSLYETLDNPDYNFFLHTSPTDGRTYPHYHWHFEIIPKTQIWAGFEISTGIEISTIEPMHAAEYLRKSLK